MSRFKDNLPPGARTFESRMGVSWSDVDIAGVLYFARYWYFADRAEFAMFDELGFPCPQIYHDHDMWLVRVHAEADYFSPAMMSDWLRMRTHVERVGGSSISWATVYTNETTNAVSAQTKLTVACIDRATMKSRALPEDLRAAFQSVAVLPA